MVFKKLNVLKKVDFTPFLFALSYFTILFIPAYIKLIQESTLFANDVAEYLLTAESWVTGKGNVFTYPYPITPILYIIPYLVIKDPLALYVFGNFVSIFIETTMTVIMYYLLKAIKRNKIANIIGAMIFGTFPLSLDIIGWGGQATLLATCFGILALFFIQKNVYNTSVKYFIFSSLMLLLSALTEPFITIYFIIAAGIILLKKRDRKPNMLLITNYIMFFFPALVAIFILVFMLNSYNEKLFVPLIIYTQSNFNIIYKLISRITFSNVIIILAIIYLSLMYILLYILVKKAINNENKNTLIACVIAFFVLFLLTPSQYADRALYLFSIPLAIVTNSIANVIVYEKNNRNIATALSLAGLTITLIIPGIGVNIYTDALSFYSIDKPLLIHILSLRHTNGDILYISPNPWAFSLAYVSTKNIYPTTQPVWFTRESQVNNAILAFTSMMGVRWIDAGEIKIVDASPLWAQPAPGIYVAKYPYYVELFRLSDGALPIAFSPSSNKSIIWNESLFYAPKKSFWNTNITMFSMYEYDTLTVSKGITVDKNGIVNITLKYNFINSFPRKIDIRLISLMLKDTRVYLLFSNNTQAKVKLTQSFEEPWYKQYYNTLVELQVQSPGVNQTTKYVERDEWGLPEIIFTLTPTAHISVISALIRIKVNDVQVKTPHIILRDDALRSNNIKFVIVDTRVHPDVLQLFERDPNFEKYEVFSHYVIYQLKES
jgi:hypothetical protein